MTIGGWQKFDVGSSAIFDMMKAVCGSTAATWKRYTHPAPPLIL